MAQHVIVSEPGTHWRCEGWDGKPGEFTLGRIYRARDDFGFGFLISETGDWIGDDRLHLGTFIRVCDQ